MARTPKDTDFALDLPGVGSFIFGRRTLGDALKIRAGYLRLIDAAGGEPEVIDPELSGYANVIATLSVLMVKAPAPQWANLESLDLVDIPNATDLVVDLFTLLKEQEDSFRGQAKGQGAA